MNDSMTNQPNNDAMPDERGERISAYLDGELGAADAAAVERLLAEDPAARKLADELRAVSQACGQAPAPNFESDLSRTVVAEALRRQAQGEGTSADDASKVEVLEPEGEFGLPFGKVAGGWSWMGVAVAAALLISFYGRPDRPSGQPVVAKATEPSPQERYANMIAALQQAAPSVQVRNVQATPQMLAALRQRLAMQSPQRAQLPTELMNVSQRGVVVEPASEALSAIETDGEELVYVDASEEEIDRLLADIARKEGGSMHTVESGRPSPATEQASAPPVGQPNAPGPRAVRVRVQLKPGTKLSLTPVPPRADGRKLVLLRIQVKPPAAQP